MSDTLVTAASHPALFAALETISHDRGAGAGHSNYAIPEPWARDIDTVERQLAPLSTAERETFCIGEESEMQAINLRYGIETAHTFLNAFFEDFETEIQR